MTQTTMIFRVIIKILYICLLFVETVISIRFVLVFVGANPNNIFVDKIMQFSELFIAPFKGIVFDDIIKIAVFDVDVNAVISLIIYMLIAFFMIEMLKAFNSDSDTS